MSENKPTGNSSPIELQIIEGEHVIAKHATQAVISHSEGAFVLNFVYIDPLDLQAARSLGSIERPAQVRAHTVAKVAMSPQSYSTFLQRSNHEWDLFLNVTLREVEERAKEEQQSIEEGSSTSSERRD